MTSKDMMQMKVFLKSMRFAVGGCGGDGSDWRLDCFDSAWYRQL